MNKYLQVAVGVIKDKTGNVLISLRHDKAHQGGLWEFPGGKVESGETVEQALARELKEELDISVGDLSPLIQIKHQYTDLNVLLDVWTVSSFSGQAKGCEGQEIKWVSQNELSDYCFPEANIPIIAAAKLPAEYAILNAGNLADCIKDLEIILNKGIKLIQARIKLLSAAEVNQFIELAQPLCQQQGAQLLINSAVANASQLRADGLHLTSTNLMALTERPSAYSWVAASCHNQQELKQAEKIGLDFVVIAPVLATQTHPDTEPLGWNVFRELVSSANIPIYALGGMQPEHLQLAKSSGAQGIAGISCFN